MPPTWLSLVWLWVACASDVHVLPHGWISIPTFVGNGHTVQGSTPGTWHSQVGQDKTVQALLDANRVAGRGPTPQRFFLDVGANDPVELSNTLALERDWNWTGICIEANAQYWWEHAQGRKCRLVAAVAGKERSAKVNFTLSGDTGGIVGEEFDNKVPPKGAEVLSLAMVPMSEILHVASAPQHIDYWSLDVEGAEYHLLSTFPWDRHTVGVLTVERPDQESVAILAANGFVCLGSHGVFGDHLLIHRPSFSPFVLSLVHNETLFESFVQQHKLALRRSVRGRNRRKIAVGYCHKGRLVVSRKHSSTVLSNRTT
mmetsp:Transcript_67540/g.119804  ORF Transcript_67540/g.119804 Transcript_67540/m.119804 type:complete len:314 (-) Transcript_67540:111-1052(-)